MQKNLNGQRTKNLFQPDYLKLQTLTPVIANRTKTKHTNATASVNQLTITSQTADDVQASGMQESQISKRRVSNKNDLIRDKKDFSPRSTFGTQLQKHLQSAVSPLSRQQNGGGGRTSDGFFKKDSRYAKKENVSPTQSALVINSSDLKSSQFGNKKSSIISNKGHNQKEEKKQLNHTGPMYLHRSPKDYGIASQMNFYNQENIKQYENNPLKDISNNYPQYQSKRASMPFEFAPQAKVNNYFDMPFTTNVGNMPQTARATNDKAKNSNPFLGQENRPSANLKPPGVTDYEKRRLSATDKQKELIKFADEIGGVLKQSDERRTKNNASVQSQSNQNMVSSNLQQSSRPRTALESQAQNQCIALLKSKEDYLITTMYSLKKRKQINFTLKDIEKKIKELTSTFKKVSLDNTATHLMKQHARAEFVTFSFLTSSILDLMKDDDVMQMAHNALFYLQQNFVCFQDLMAGSNIAPTTQVRKGGPFGNKRESVKESRTQKISERKQSIQNNLQFTLAFLKKICRSQASPSFRDLLEVVNRIETGQTICRVKEQIKRILSRQKQIVSEKQSAQKQGMNSTQKSPDFSLKEPSSFLDQENLPPNFVEQKNRLSLQPQSKTDQHFLSIKKKSSRAQNHDHVSLGNQTDRSQKRTDIDERVVFAATNQLLNAPDRRRDFSGDRIPKLKEKEDDAHLLHSAMKSKNGVISIEAPPHLNPRSSSEPRHGMILPEIKQGMDYTLVLDLDETLIHFDAKKSEFRIRPYTHRFLRELSQYFELVIFTAGLQDYADSILNLLDKEKTITHRLYRTSCKFKGGYYTKELTQLGREMKKTIIIDNTPENFEEQEENGIHIESWYSDSQDRELIKMISFLKSLVKNRVPDVRPMVKMFKSQLTKTHKREDSPATVPSARPHNGKKENVNYKSSSEEESTHRKKKDQSDSEVEDSDEEKYSGSESPIKKKAKKDSSDEEESSDDSPKKKTIKKDDSDQESESDESSKKNKKKAKNDSNSEEEDNEGGKLKELESKIEEKDKDLDKLQKKVLEQDEIMSEMRKDNASKEVFAKELEEQLTNKNVEIRDFQEEIRKHKDTILFLEQFRLSADTLQKQLTQKEDEAKIMKAKLTLDLIDFKCTIAPEDPELLDDYNKVSKDWKELDYKFRRKKAIKRAEKQAKNQLIEVQKEKVEEIRNLKAADISAQSMLKYFKAELEKQGEVKQVYEDQITDLERAIEAKNDELEDRLETVSKLIGKNEQLSQQLRVTKNRFEKFKKEHTGVYQKQLSDKDSEIEVLKEMVRGNQLQVKAREKEIARLKSKLQQAEIQGAKFSQAPSQSNYQFGAMSSAKSKQSYKVPGSRFTSGKSANQSNTEYLPPIDQQNYSQSRAPPAHMYQKSGDPMVTRSSVNSIIKNSQPPMPPVQKFEPAPVFRDDSYYDNQASQQELPKEDLSSLPDKEYSIKMGEDSETPVDQRFVASPNVSERPSENQQLNQYDPDESLMAPIPETVPTNPDAISPIKPQSDAPLTQESPEPTPQKQESSLPVQPKSPEQEQQTQKVKNQQSPQIQYTGIDPHKNKDQTKAEILDDNVRKSPEKTIEDTGSPDKDPDFEDYL